MNKDDYRELLRNMACHFCKNDRPRYVSWHHLLCIGQHGKALKPPPWATLPTCKKCHLTNPENCHNYGISRTAQKLAMVYTWYVIGREHMTPAKFERLRNMLKINVQDCSNDEWKALGEKYWSMLGGK